MGGARDRHDTRCGMRWTRWCRKTCGRVAYGQAVWSCPLDAGVKFAEIIGERRWLKSPTHEGERGAAVKPLRRECRSDFGVPVLACVRLFYFARKALGAACTRYDTADKCDELAPLHVPLKQNSIDLAMSRLCRARVKVRQGSQDDMSAQNFDVCFGSGHRAACSGHHRKRTSTRQVSMSAWCHKRTIRGSKMRGYSSTSSALKMTDWGIVRPCIFAVLTFTTMVKCAGSSTGRSAGLVPFRILSMNAAERLKLQGIQTP